MYILSPTNVNNKINPYAKKITHSLPHAYKNVKQTKLVSAHPSTPTTIISLPKGQYPSPQPELPTYTEYTKTIMLSTFPFTGGAIPC